MPAIYQAWNWIVSSNIDIDQSSSMQIDNSESQISDMQIGKEVFKENNRLIIKLQTEEDQIL